MVNLADAIAEQERCRKENEGWPPEDVFNDDETGFFWKAPPDRGLALKEMKGKKKEKSRITIAFACNATGTEMLEPFFIGTAKKPQCFNGVEPSRRGFYYRNNGSAWMTAELYKEWIKKLDIEFGRQGRKIKWWSDNFKGHEISYKPKNIEMCYFRPNLTSHVQPLDAGIIRKFKAHYRREFCLRALRLDDEGERDIFKIDIRDAMTMAKEAWKAVTPETVRNCWKHSKIMSEAPQ